MTEYFGRCDVAALLTACFCSTISSYLNNSGRLPIVCNSQLILNLVLTEKYIKLKIATRAVENLSSPAG